MKYRGEGFSIHNVLCDNEPALTALEPTLGSMGIKLITAGIKSNHIAALDRAIRLLKDRVGSTLAELPYILPRQLKSLVEFVVQNLNMISHSYSPSLTLSPRELFTGRKTDFKIDIRVSFGAYVQCYQPSSDNSMSERTLGCIALCPTGKKNGSVKFLHLKSGRIIIADHWKELPVPDNIISYMNDPSSKYSKPSRRDPTFLWKRKQVGPYLEANDHNREELSQKKWNTAKSSTFQCLLLISSSLTILPTSFNLFIYRLPSNQRDRVENI
jgi:hypothetical protein